MNKDFWKILFTWLETASLEDIKHKRSVVLQMLDQIHDRGLKADIRRILRFMDEEVLARTEISKLLSVA